MMLRATLVAALFVLPAAAFAQATTPTAPPAPARYVDLVDWPALEASLERFSNAEAALGRAFAQTCADTFCEGDFGNLSPMQLKCSVDTTKGILKQCLWTFAGSHAGVNPKSGAVQVTAQLFKCRLPLAKDTPVEQFLQQLESENPLEGKLPMSRVSIYDGLLTCLG